MHFEKEIDIFAKAEDIFNIYKDVANWKTWDLTLKDSSLNGNLRVGAIGIRQPKKGLKSIMTMTEVVPNKHLSIRNRLPMCSMLSEYSIEPKGDMVKVTHGIKFTGIMSPIYRRLIGSELNKNLPESLEGLKAVAESKKGSKTTQFLDSELSKELPI